MRLFNHADGVDGHYCIGRRIGGSEFWEFWNPTGWAGHGKLFTTLQSAEHKFAQLMKNGYWRKLPCDQHKDRFCLECASCNGKNAEWVEVKAKVPTKPGFYWAQWLTAAQGTHEGDQLTPANDWEVVEVWENFRGDPCEADKAEKFGVSVTGVRESQWLENFKWGEGPIERKS